MTDDRGVAREQAHVHHVEAKWLVAEAMLGEVVLPQPDEALLLAGGDGLGAAAAAQAPAGLDLDEDPARAVAADEVQLAEGRAVVACYNRVSEPFEVLRGEGFAVTAEVDAAHASPLPCDYRMTRGST
ncbi:hypothetical protein D3C87_705610 [compost metagenome]